MKKKQKFFSLLLTVVISVTCFLYQAKGQVNGRWSGTMTESSVFTHSAADVRDESQVDINFTDNFGNGSYRKYGVARADGMIVISQTCNGSGAAELVVASIDKENRTYTIQAITQTTTTCTSTGPGGTVTDVDSNDADITVMDQPWDGNPKVLKGSKTEVTDSPDGGKLKTTTTWNLVKQSEVELIVTPQNYDNWLPEPGRDEQTPGTVMSIALKLQDSNGRTSSEKAKAFKLRLSNTSKEKGITLNVPLVPSSQQQPDLRFLRQPGASLSEEDQFMIIYCPSGCLTANLKIASFDGGGWTTLSAVAMLETDSINGNLLESGGEEDIRIPKRDPGTKIAKAWLTANGNPGESDDKETSAGTSNIGDGLSAYEEYRGFISEGRYMRLDPQTKELGIKMKRAEISLFSSGITKFETATGIKVIRFGENEIGADRKLNKNHLTAHIYDQYALFLQKGTLTGDLGKSFGGPAIPMQVSKTVIDQNRIRLSYQDRLAEGRSINQTLSYSEKDLFETVTAHELSHSVNVKHHGSLAPNSLNLQILPGKPVRIFHYSGSEILTRPYTITGRGGDTGNEQSGDVNCFMLNNALCDWAVRTTPDSMFFYQVPLIPLGTTLCTQQNGTGLNSLKDANGNYQYFGDAANGNCLSQIKLK